MFADAALAHLASHAQGEPPAQHDGKNQTSLQGDLEELGRRTAASGVAQGFACGASRLAYENVPLGGVEKRKRTAQASLDGSSSAPRRVNEVRRMRQRRPGCYLRLGGSFTSASRAWSDTGLMTKASKPASYASSSSRSRPAPVKAMRTIGFAAARVLRASS